jgi:hypothetical protein
MRTRKLNLGDAYSCRRRLAQAVAKVSHVLASNDFEARGGTITPYGLRRLLEAHELLGSVLHDLVVDVPDDVPSRNRV